MYHDVVAAGREDESGFPGGDAARYKLTPQARMTINSLGIGVGPEGSDFDRFLSTLAQQNYGQYERVDR